MKDSIKIYNRDGFEVMRDCGSNSVDMIMTDPPYNVDKDYDEYDDDRPWDDYWQWIEDFVNLAAQILKEDGAMYVVTPNNQRREWLEVIDKSPFEEILGSPNYWCRPNFAGGPRNLSGYRTSVYVVYSLKLENGEHEVNDEKMPHVDFTNQNFIVSTAPQSDFNGELEKQHPTQQPVKVYEKHILKSTEKGDTVLDPFMGGGTTGVACKKWSRKFIGADISEDYCELSEKRISKTQAKARQLTL